MEDDLPLEIALPRTAAAILEGDPNHVRDVLQDELERLVDDLMQDAFSNSGGGSDDEELQVEHVDITGGALRARVIIDFTEQMPSGCRDMTFPEERRIERTVVMNVGEQTATVLPDRADPDNWDVADSNSAGDGGDWR